MAGSHMALTMARLQVDDDPSLLGRDDLDLSYWEFVNNSDADYSDDSFSIDSLSDDVISCDSFSSSLLPQIGEMQVLPQDVHDLEDRDWLVADQNQSRIVVDRGDLVDESRKAPVPDEGHYAYKRPLVDGSPKAPGRVGVRNLLSLHGTCGFACDGREEGYNRDRGDDDDGDEYDDDDDACDLDDELVPRWASGKLGRQRMRKLSKRAFSKISSSKRLPYSHVKPGCLYGKHGYGMNFRS